MANVCSRLRVTPLVLSLILGGVAFHVPALADQALDRAVAESNVNQQYVIESVSISGIEVNRFHDAKLSPSLRRRLTALVGSQCDMSASATSRVAFVPRSICRTSTNT